MKEEIRWIKILEKYIDWQKSCLSVMDMLYKYKDIFSLRDEIGTCPNIEVKIDSIDKFYRKC